MIVSDPTDDREDVNVAFPEPSTVTDDSMVAPFVNTTVPLGVPAPGPTTDSDAVNVTDWPYTAGWEFKPRTVVALSTVWVTPLDALVANDGSPP